MYTVVADTVGQRPARLGLRLGFVAFVCASVTTIAAFFYAASVWVIRPVIAKIPALPQGAVQTTAISFGVAGIVVACVGYVFMRHIRSRDNRLVMILENS